MRTLVSTLVILTALISLPLQAGPLDDARAAGHVLEMPNGYIKAHGDVAA